MSPSSRVVDVYLDHAPFLLARMSRRCGSRDGVDGVVRDVFAALPDQPCPPDDLAPELFARACEACEASPVCERARQARDDTRDLRACC